MGRGTAELKRCITCEELKPSDEFYIRRDQGKLRNTCKTCDRRGSREYYAKPPKHRATHPRDEPAMFDGPKLVAWIEGRLRWKVAWEHIYTNAHLRGNQPSAGPTLYHGSHTTQRRLYDWRNNLRKHSGLTTIGRVDEVLTDLGLHLNEVPAECWLDPNEAWLEPETELEAA